MGLGCLGLGFEFCGLRSEVWFLWFGVQGLGFSVCRVWGLGLRVKGFVMVEGFGLGVWVTLILSRRRIILTICIQGSGFRVQGSGFRVQGSGFRVPGSGFRVPGSGFRVQGSGFRGSGFRILGLGCRVQGLGFSI